MYYVVLVIILITGDQLLKWWVTLNISNNGFKKFIPGFLGLTNLHNDGAAWSMLEGKQWFFAIVSVIAIVALLYLMHWFRERPLVEISLALILGGTIGNFIDRLRFGYVVDMFQFLPVNFPVFNLADTYLTVGVIILIFIILLEKDDDNHAVHSTSEHHH